jgi:hypothetical protein
MKAFIAELEVKSRQRAIEAKAEIEYRTNEDTLLGRIAYSEPRGGMGDSPGYLYVSLDVPEEFECKSGWDIKKGIVHQLNGKRVTVKIHD